jgi:hypothetical protein
LIAFSHLRSLVRRIRQYNVGHIAQREGSVRWPWWRVAVAERSMEPALFPGDWLLAWRGWRPGQPVRIRAGQLVIAPHPARPGLLLVKRATQLHPEGWWLSSDNPAAGAVDSRSFGPVAAELIEARVLLRYWPVMRARRRRPHSEAGPVPPWERGQQR